MIEIVAKAEARVESPFVRTADDAEYQLIQTAHKAANAGNWVIGECASRWFHGYARGRTDAAFAEMIEQGEDKVFQCRRVWEKFGQIYAGFKHLTWSHFRAALQWDDAPEFLEWAEDCEATVKEMIAYRSVRVEDVRNDSKPLATKSERSHSASDQGSRNGRSTKAEESNLGSVSVRAAKDAPVQNMARRGSLATEPEAKDEGSKAAGASARQSEPEEALRVEPSRTVDLALNQIGELLHFAFEHGTEDERDALLEIIRPIWLQLAPPSLLPARVPQIQAGLAIANTIVNEWNMIDGVTVCRAVTPARRKRIADRMRDVFWKEHWREAIDKIRNLKCLQGANDQNWRADIDWFIRPDTVAKVLEGKYDNWKPTGSAADRRKMSNDAAFDEVFG